MAKNQLILCDTNIIIELFRGDEKTRESIHEIGLGNIAISIITFSEVLQGMRKREEEQTLKFLNSVQVLHLSKEISKHFKGLISNYSISHRLRIADALIAATAIANGLTLFTYDRGDFRFIPEITLFNPK